MEGKIKTLWKKEKGKRIEITVPKEVIDNLENFNEYCIQGVRQPMFFENSRINSHRNMTLNDIFTSRALRAIDLLLTAINQYNEQIKRALLLILTASLGQMSNMVFAVTNRGKTKGQTYDKVEVGSWVIGYWRPEQHFEINSWNCFENKAKKLLNSLKMLDKYSFVNIVNNYESFKILNTPNHLAYIQIGDSEQLLKDIPDNTLKLILTDPPHGDRIPYLELSEMWNCCLSLEANFEDELIISNAKERRKTKDIYNDKLSKIFTECNRVLMCQGILAVMFNSRAKEHWESLRTLEKVTDLEYLGYYPMEYSAGSVVQDNRKGGLKTDYVLIYAKQLTESRKNQILQIFSKIQAWKIQYPIEEGK